jgi:hypothetical protein
MSKSFNFIDLFDWEKESDRHYMEVLMHTREEEFEWNDWVKKQSKKPAKIEVEIIKTQKKDDSKFESSSF